LTHKDTPWEWTERHQATFDALKSRVASAPVLTQPDFTKPFFVDTDASQHALGAVLQQKDEQGRLHPIVFHSKTFDATQRNWDVADRELFAIIDALETWRVYLVGAEHQVTVRTDHRNLQYFKQANKLSRCQARWIPRLEEYDYIIEHIPG